MVICHRCILADIIVPLHVETWFVRVHRRHQITRYWECPVCKLSGSRQVL
jgi:hypothetical protein